VPFNCNTRGPRIWHPLKLREQMVYLLGKSLNMYKRVYYALRGSFEGVGMATARRVCDQTLVHPLAKVKDLSEAQLIRLKELIQPIVEAYRQGRLARVREQKIRSKPIDPT